jgi:hypothetical protein
MDGKRERRNSVLESAAAGRTCVSVALVANLDLAFGHLRF